MGICVCMGANLQCSFGAAPSTLIVNSQTTVLVASKPAATIMDCKPMGNIPPFGMCSCPANPATVKPPPVMFAPAPCVPVITAPWTPGSPTVLLGGSPALNNSSKLMCAWGGVISVLNPGQFQTSIP
ncbi:MAG TPA: DUF4280 domain-containing protein [Candidatus Intestinimonas stercorigallinarum]|nr:DUF4280 domain-containing protein [Candidatus Intestinimonas stercorigallinarum]